MSAKGGPGFDVLPLPSGGTLLLLSHPASWPGLKPAEVLSSLRAQGARTVVSLVTDQELLELGLSHLAELSQEQGVEWLHAPIEDQQAPDAAFEQWWHDHWGALCTTLDQGHAVALHCWGGLGRTGTVAARLLMQREQMLATAAMASVRQARPGSIETVDQELHLLAWSPQSTT